MYTLVELFDGGIPKKQKKILKQVAILVYIPTKSDKIPLQF